MNEIAHKNAECRNEAFSVFRPSLEYEVAARTGNCESAPVINGSFSGLLFYFSALLVCFHSFPLSDKKVKPKCSLFADLLSPVSKIWNPSVRKSLTEICRGYFWDLDRDSRSKGK